jgi:hypothetical protein
MYMTSDYKPYSIAIRGRRAFHVACRWLAVGTTYRGDRYFQIGKRQMASIGPQRKEGLGSSSDFADGLGLT